MILLMNSHILKNLEKDIKLVISNEKDIKSNIEEEHLKAYYCWKESWSFAFTEEMKLKEKLYSDNFSRQDQIVSLFYQNECVGLACSRYIDLNNPIALDDSFFKAWPDSAIDKVRKMGGVLSTASSFTIGKKFRGKGQIIRWKHLMIELFVRNFKFSNADLMVAATRKNKSNDILTYISGANPIETDLSYQNIPGEIMDIVYWKNPVVSLSTSEISRLADRVWKNYSFETNKHLHQFRLRSNL